MTLGMMSVRGNGRDQSRPRFLDMRRASTSSLKRREPRQNNIPTRGPSYERVQAPSEKGAQAECGRFSAAGKRSAMRRARRIAGLWDDWRDRGSGEARRRNGSENRDHLRMR